MADIAGPRAIDRRAFIRMAGVAFAGAAALPLLAACTPSTPAAPTSAPATAAKPTTAPAAAPTTAPAAAPTAAPAVAPTAAAAAKPTAAPVAAANGKLQMPTYVPFQGPKPDFAPSSDGIVPPGYLTYPKQLVKTVNGPVGKGENVNFLTYTINPPVPALDQNAAWQNLNKKMGVNLSWNAVALADWNNKLSAVIASNDLPDLFTIDVLGVLIPNQIDFLKANCQDLTPFLSGDAVKDYPNLANFPPIAWRNTIFDNKIYALPRLSNSVGQTMLVKQNILDEMGVKSITSADQYMQLLKDITQTYKIPATGGVQATNGTLGWTGGLFGVPNNWRNDNGTFTRSWETPEFKEVVAFLRQQWDAGVVHPETPTWSGNQGAATFYASKTATYPTAFFAYGIAWDRLLTIDKSFKLNIIPAFGANGHEPVNYQASGINQLTVIKKTSPDRVKLLLNVLNYLAAPFGTEEYRDVTSGVEGTDFNYNEQGNPILTQQGVQEVQFTPWTTILNSYLPLYDPNDPNFVSQAQPQEIAAHEIGLTDPTIGLYSNTQATKGATLDQAMYDAVNNVLFGRSPVSSLDDAVATWRKNGGDTIKGEYAQAAQAAA